MSGASHKEAKFQEGAVRRRPQATLLLYPLASLLKHTEAVDPTVLAPYGFITRLCQFDRRIM